MRDTFAGETPGGYSPRLAIRRMRHRHGPRRPSRSLLICTNPRSGSWMLCTALAKTGLAGYPSEYFIPWDEADWAREWGTTDTAGFLDALLLEATSPNGVCAAKIMYGHLGHIVDRAAQVPAHRDLAAPHVLANVFPDVRYVWLRRRDTVRQAVSHARAIRSGVWAVSTARAETTADTCTDQDLDLVEHLMREAIEQDEGWEQFFAESGRVPLVLWYEDMVADFSAAVRAVLNHAGVSGEIAVPEPDVRRQADPVSEAWVARCRSRLARVTL